MSSTLTSWKEISQYLGKGVRTVQRWEQQMGLPVRRPQSHVKGVVLALTDELDLWVRSQFENGSESELKLLRTELAEVRQENKQLRTTLERAESAAIAVSPNRWGMEQDEYQTITEIHRLQTTAAQQRLQSIRSQIAFGLTLCRAAENALSFGHTKDAHKAIANVQKLCDTVWQHLNEQNHVPPNEAEKLCAELTQLQSKILTVGTLE